MFFWMKIPEFCSKLFLDEYSGTFIQKNIKFFWMKIPEFRSKLFLDEYSGICIQKPGQ